LQFLLNPLGCVLFGKFSLFFSANTFGIAYQKTEKNFSKIPATQKCLYVKDQPNLQPLGHLSIHYKFAVIIAHL